MTEPRPPYYRRSIIGPLVLVCFGVLALALTMGWLSWPSFWHWFSRYWPLLLIVWGVVKLGEALWARQHGVPSPRIGGGAIVFLVFFILFGMIVTNAANVNWRGVGDAMDFDPGWDFGFWGGSHEFTENFSQVVPEGSQIRVLAARSNISVSASPDNQVHAFVHKYLRAYSDDEASRMNDASHPKMQHQGDLWLLDMTGDSYTRGRFDLDLQVPRSSPLYAEARWGDIRVSQRDASVMLQTSQGELAAEEIKGNVSLRRAAGSIRLRHSDVTVRQVTGDVSVDGYVGDTNISDINGTLNLTGTFTGDMQLARIAKQVHFNSTRTDLQFARLDGELNMDLTDLRGKQVVGPFKLDATSKDVNLESVSGDIHIENKNGNIEVQPSPPLGTMDVSSARGDITVTLPEKPGFQLTAETGVGEISSDFSLNISKDRRNSTASGTVGKDGPQVRLKTLRGEIQIHKQ